MQIHWCSTGNVQQLSPVQIAQSIKECPGPTKQIPECLQWPQKICEPLGQDSHVCVTLPEKVLPPEKQLTDTSNFCDDTGDFSQSSEKPPNNCLSLPYTYLLRPDLRVSVGLTDHGIFSDMTVLDSVLLMSFQQVQPASSVILTKGTLCNTKLPVRAERGTAWETGIFQWSLKGGMPEISSWGMMAILALSSSMSLIISTVWRLYLAGRMF